MDYVFLTTAFVTLFVVVDPIGMAPLFVAMTQDFEARRRRGIAIRACLVAFGILVLFTIFGEAVLGFAGITMPAFRVAGGILLFLTALDMLFERRTKRREDRSHDDEGDDPAVFPIAIPLIAGPGSIASVILLAGLHPAGSASPGYPVSLRLLSCWFSYCFWHPACLRGCWGAWGSTWSHGSWACFWRHWRCSLFWTG